MLNALRGSKVKGWSGPLKMAAYEAAFRLFCRHRQGTKPNILLHCTRRTGSTWLMNTVCAHPGMRSEGRPFMTALYTRHRQQIPDLAKAAGYTGPHKFACMVHFEGEDERRFRAFAESVVCGRTVVYPMLRFWEPYFQRVTDRVIYQMTTTTAMAEWFSDNFNCQNVVLLRHPITSSLSTMAAGWQVHCWDFLYHRWFVENYLTGEQVDLSRRIMESGSTIEQHVLDWTLKMLVPIRALASGRHPDWMVVTYERIVREPEVVLQELSRQLDLPDIEAMRSQVKLPSRTVSKTSSDKVDDPDYILNRWRKKIDAEQERQLMGILEAFEIDTYRVGDAEPHLMARS